MYIIDDSAWPIVVIESRGRTTMGDLEAYISAWERWLARDEPMGVIMKMVVDETKAPRDVNKRGNEWQLANRDRIAACCVGVAGVLSSKLLVFYKPIIAQAMKRRMGCPGAAFGTDAEAVGWLQERLHAPIWRRATQARG